MHPIEFLSYIVATKWRWSTVERSSHYNEVRFELASIDIEGSPLHGGLNDWTCFENCGIGNDFFERFRKKLRVASITSCALCSIGNVAVSIKNV